MCQADRWNKGCQGSHLDALRVQECGCVSMSDSSWYYVEGDAKRRGNTTKALGSSPSSATGTEVASWFHRREAGRMTSSCQDLMRMGRVPWRTICISPADGREFQGLSDASVRKQNRGRRCATELGKERLKLRWSDVVLTSHTSRKMCIFVERERQWSAVRRLRSEHVQGRRSGYVKWSC